jgi:integrase/recombinase XerC
MNHLVSYSAGERACDNCGDLLPDAVEVWSGHNYLVCKKPECIGAAKAHKKNKWVGLNEIPCSADGCTNFIPEGSYVRRMRLPVCSIACWKKRAAHGIVAFKCDHCREDMFGHRHKGRHHFCDKDCYRLWLLEESIKRAGSYRPLLERYFTEFVPFRYRGLTPKAVRSVMITFGCFLDDQEIADLNLVTPVTISAYLMWCVENEYDSASTTISLLSTFFYWMIANGERQLANPVVSSIHRKKFPKRLPRPYSEEELAYMWKLLHERGNSRVRAIASIAEEAGLRLGELARLALSDIDLAGQRVFVDIPNKGNKERYAFFGKKTRHFVQAWLQDRDSECGHDKLFHNTLGGPCKESQIWRELNIILSKVFDGKTHNEEGFDDWSIHRLRHTMATTLGAGGADAVTIMEQGGWSTFEAMSGYLATNPEKARRGYTESMERGETMRKSKPNRSTLSLEALQQHLKKAS